MDRKKLCRMAAVSLMVGVVLALLWGMWSLRQQEMLSRQVIRLHVIAASDSAEDQQLKLQVRDAVLAEAEHILLAAESREEAEQLLREHLGDMEQCAREAVRAAEHDDAVRVLFTEETYPTREYGTFSLPGGVYLSLRVLIGAGEGHNWWCVVFPPLCAASSVEELEESGLSRKDVALITQSDEEYVLKFKSIELWESCHDVWQNWKK